MRLPPSLCAVSGLGGARSHLPHNLPESLFKSQLHRLKSQQKHESDRLLKMPRWPYVMEHMGMVALISIVVFIVLYSRTRATQQGKPWFSWGGKRKRVQPQPAYLGAVGTFRLRTENIKPRSPWLYPQSSDVQPVISTTSQQAKKVKPKAPVSQPKPATRSAPAVPTSKATAQKNKNQPPGRSVNRSAEYSALNKLIALTHSSDVADRLVDRVAEKNPDRSRLWCVDKAIWDIKRDRMAR